MALTGPPPTTSDMTAPSTRKLSSSARDSPLAASCCGTETKRRAAGWSGVGHNTPSPFPRATTTFGTEAPTNSNSTTEVTTAATGRWTFTSGNPSRCQRRTSSSSSLRPGIPNLSTGISTRGKRSNNPLTTRPNENEDENEDENREPKVVAAERRIPAAAPFAIISTWDSFSNPNLRDSFLYPLETILNPQNVSREREKKMFMFLLRLSYLLRTYHL